jgi:DNA-binding FadR family transcriptional regulator
VLLFAFSELMFIQSQPRDLVHQADQHEIFAEAILSKNRQQARQTTHKVLTDFWKFWRMSAK